MGLLSTNYASRAGFEQIVAYSCEHCERPNRAVVRGSGFGYVNVRYDVLFGEDVSAMQRAARGAGSSAEAQFYLVLRLAKCPRCSRPSAWAEAFAVEDEAKIKARYRLMAWLAPLCAAIAVFLMVMTGLSMVHQVPSLATLLAVGVATALAVMAALLTPHGGTPPISAEVLFFPDEGGDPTLAPARAELAVRPQRGSSYGAAALGFLAVIVLVAAFLGAVSGAT